MIESHTIKETCSNIRKYFCMYIHYKYGSLRVFLLVYYPTYLVFYIYAPKLTFAWIALKEVFAYIPLENSYFFILTPRRSSHSWSTPWRFNRIREDTGGCANSWNDQHMNFLSFWPPSKFWRKRDEDTMELFLLYKNLLNKHNI